MLRDSKPTTIPTTTGKNIDVFSPDPVEINCVFLDVPERLEIFWDTAVQQASHTFIGNHSSVEDTHISRLALSSRQLTSLKSSGRSHTFTCKIIAGTSKTPVSGSQTISIFTPSKSSSNLFKFYLEISAEFYWNF